MIACALLLTGCNKEEPKPVDIGIDSEGNLTAYGLEKEKAMEEGTAEEARTPVSEEPPAETGWKDLLDAGLTSGRHTFRENMLAIFLGLMSFLSRVRKASLC